MRTIGFVQLFAAFSFQWALIKGHPLCYFDDRPTDYDQKLSFCPKPQDGACCNDLEEEGIVNQFLSAGLTGKCADLYKEVVCGPCHSYSAHLYEKLGKELGSDDGMTMRNDFCQELVKTCASQVEFKTYGGESYCEKHTGGGKDMYWSYPYTEPEIFEPGISELFDLDSGSLPESSIAMHMSPDSNWWWVAGREGMMKEISASKLDVSNTVMDLAKHDDFYEAYEEGLLDFAFGPEYTSNKRFYCSWSVGTKGSVKNRLSMFIRGSSTTATLNSEATLLESSIRSTSIHAGGWLGFKPSVYGKDLNNADLYWSMGDSGAQEDPEEHGQNLQDLHSTIVRISVPKSGSGYTIPKGNVGGGALPEICAYGFRNPWRCSFDRQTDVLYCGDVGHTAVEAIYTVECGKNYGWSDFEGRLCREWHGANCAKVSRSGIETAMFEYCHPGYDSGAPGQEVFTGGVDFCPDTITGHAVIGGYVYRGFFFADLLAGAYIFGDYQNAKIYYLKEVDGEWDLGTIIGDGSLPIVSFAEDNDGEIYMIDKNWKIYRMPCGDLCATTCLDQGESLPTYKSLGCYADYLNSKRVLSHTATSCGEGENAMSPAICAAYCSTISGMTLFAVEYSYQCYCGKSGEDYDKQGSLSEDQCKYLCTAFPDETCGGNGAMEVYSMGKPAPTPAPAMVVEPIDPTPPTPTPPTPTPPTPTPSDDYDYLGCYGDGATRVFSGLFVKGQADMSTATCAEFCSGYKYFGTQHYDECFCGVASDVYSEYGQSTKCVAPCSGDVTETCGGSYALSVYEFSGSSKPPAPTPTPSGDYKYTGCFVDSGSDRLLSGAAVKGDSGMTTAVCAGICVGSTFFGTEYSKECFCGSPGDDPTDASLASCTMACAGDSSETCGGRDAISVYNRGGSPTPTPPTPTPPTPTPPTFTPSGDYDYIGCYADDLDRVLTGTSVKGSTDMTTAVCAGICEGSKYFATQYSKECFCSKPGDEPTELGPASCTMACAGDPFDTCGGSLAMSLYEFESGAGGGGTGGGYLGCYVDKGGDRIMAEKYVDSEMTVELCDTVCSGLSYYGLQYGKECWCGGASTDYDKHSGLPNCNFACGGDSSQTCGGRDAMSVYQY